MKKTSLDSLVIFVHGGPGFDEYLEQSFGGPMKDAHVKCRFYQQTKNVSMSALTQQLAHEILSAQETNVFLVGHSWGVALSLETLKQESKCLEKVSGLVLIDGFVSADMDQAFHEELKNRGLLEKYSMEDIFLSDEDLKVQELRNYLKQLMETLDASSLDRIYKEYIESVDLRPFIKTLQIPVSVIYGEKDVRVPATYHQSYASLFPNVDVLEIKGAGHFPFLRASDLALVVERISKLLHPSFIGDC